MQIQFANPFRPGAGHRPPYLAGRKQEKEEFRNLLNQTVVTDNMILTGLRGVGKTALLEELKPIALASGWLWVGTDMSEAASIGETAIATRLIADLSVVTSGIEVGEARSQGFGFTSDDAVAPVTLSYEVLLNAYNATPGLVIDKLKRVFALVADAVGRVVGARGIVFAYDEAQNLADHAQKEQFPLSLLLDLFQSIQRQGAPFLLVLVGLPTLFPKLVEARTYAERMFRVVNLMKLTEPESKEAIETPIRSAKCPVKFSTEAVNLIYEHSGGYPYFIQFICREAFDAFIQLAAADKTPTVPIKGIIRKLDTDFFAGRWARVTDRHQELLYVIASLDNSADEFTVQEIVTKSEQMLPKPFGRSHVQQILTTLISSGLIYRDRHGKYLFAVPLMDEFILRVYTNHGGLLRAD